MVSDVTVTEAKARARAAAYIRRKAAFAAGQGGACDHLAGALAGYSGQVVAGYMPMRTEIDPLPAMATHIGPLCVPVIVARGAALRFRHWTPDCVLEPGAFGALIPTSGDWLVPTVLIVPLLAFDARGYRLGYGGGFYDRTLATLRKGGPVTAIGYAFADQEVPEVPIDATDARLDAVVTEQGLRQF